MSRTILFILSCLSLLAGCGGPCGNEVAQTIASPSGAFKAIIFSRNCGATTGFNTQVSILGANESLPNESGNTFITNGAVPIVVQWQNNSALHISSVGSTHPVKQSQRVSDVAVTYAN